MVVPEGWFKLATINLLSIGLVSSSGGSLLGDSLFEFNSSLAVMFIWQVLISVE